MGEGAAEVSAVDVAALFLGGKDVLTAGAVDLNAGVAQSLAHTNRNDELVRAKHAWTHTEDAVTELVAHESETFLRDDEARMNEPV